MDLSFEECLETILRFVPHADIVLQDRTQGRVSGLTRCLSEAMSYEEKQPRGPYDLLLKFFAD
jgi:hypothetical protein